MFRSCILYFVLLIGICMNVQCSIDDADDQDRLARLILRLLSRSACADPSQCRSKWGYCGTGELYCGDGCQGGPCSGGSHGGGGGSGCANPSQCRSKWGYCGTGELYCGDGCQGGPCWGGNRGGTGNGGSGNGGSGSVGVIDNTIFACVFPNLDSSTRDRQFQGLKDSGWVPANKEEAAVFLAHVYHETDGLKSMREYCAPGCGPNYAQSWCGIQPAPGKYYYGRGWFQLSYPCNYYQAGQAIGVDLLNNPDLVENDPKVAVGTAVWFYKTNKMEEPARRGDFAATTRIINSIECGAGNPSQQTRVETYKRIRQCFNLGSPTISPYC